jgi:hypothetical protein
MKKNIFEGFDVADMKGAIKLAAGGIVSELTRQWMRFREKVKRNKTIKEGIKFAKEYTELKNNLNFDYSSNKEKINIDSDKHMNFMSDIINQAIQAGNIENHFNGLLECNIDLHELAKSKDGFLRGYCFDANNKFKAQAKFREVDKVAAASPMIAFQAAAFITGQYYQHIITKQLNEIGSKVSYIATLLEADDRNEIKSIYNQLRNFMSLEKLDESDLERAKEALQKMDKFRGKYHDLIESVKIEVKHSLLKNENEINDWCKEFKDSKFIIFMEAAYWAEVLYFLYNMLLIKHYGLNDEHAKIYLKDANPYFYEKYAKKFHDIKYVVTQNIQMLSEDASMHKEECIKTLKAIEGEFAQIEVLYSNGQKMLEPTILYKVEDGKIVETYLPKKSDDTNS